MSRRSSRAVDRKPIKMTQKYLSGMEVEVPAESESVYAPLTEDGVEFGFRPEKRSTPDGHAVTLNDLRKDFTQDGPCHLVCQCGAEKSFSLTVDALDWVAAHLQRQGKVSPRT